MVKRNKIVKKLDDTFSIYIRRRYAIDDLAECFTCGKVDHWKNLQCGHFQSRRKYSTRWDKINCQVQCAKCNIFNQGEQYIFGKKLDKVYGEGTSNELALKGNYLVKFSTKEIELLINTYKDLINKL